MQATSYRALYLKAMVQIQAEQNLLPLEESMKPNIYLFKFFVCSFQTLVSWSLTVKDSKTKQLF